MERNGKMERGKESFRKTTLFGSHMHKGPAAGGRIDSSVLKGQSNQFLFGAKTESNICRSGETVHSLD